MTTANRRTPNKLGAASLTANAVVIFLVWLVFFWAGGVNSLSGLNSVHGNLVWVTAAVPALILIAGNLTLARQLWRGGFDD